MIFAAFALATTPMTMLSQRGGLAPESPASFSSFSMPQSIGLPVNSPDNESAAFLAPNGLSLYFSSTRTGGLGSIDIWVAQRPSLSSAWGTPINVEGVNSGSNENLPVLSGDGRTMFFNCSCPDSIGGADIYMSTRPNPTVDTGWTAPVNIGTVVNTTDGEVAASYFEDPTTGAAILYFTSDRGSGLGGEDIWQSTRNADGTFNAPTNVAALNSSTFDRGISISRDGLEAFLTSDRDGGLGGRDIWTSTRASVSAPWNLPVNVASVNLSAADQMPSLSPDGSVLFFSSSRDGSPDIYTATRVSVNRSVTADFDGDGRSDLSIYRPVDGTWHVLQTGTNTYSVQPFGLSTDKIVPGDYDGDGRCDFAVFRPSAGDWYVLKSSDGVVLRINWGLSADRPVPADYNGDGRTDFAVYRNGTWYIHGQSSPQQFGLSSDLPVAGVQ